MVASAEKTVHVQYFAILREQRGLSEESIRTAATTAADLYNDLRAAHRFSLPLERMKVVVNDSFAEWESVLKEGDRIVFVPPVAGG
jgi:molybdopterin converting factor small subunit